MEAAHAIAFIPEAHILFTAVTTVDTSHPLKKYYITLCLSNTIKFLLVDEQYISYRKYSLFYKYVIIE